MIPIETYRSYIELGPGVIYNIIIIGGFHACKTQLSLPWNSKIRD